MRSRFERETRMSRAINVNASKTDVEALCLKHKAPISAIETLASGGTRVVFMNGDAAAAMNRVFGRKVLSGTVERTPLRLRTV
jgi:UDP-2,3-diacylglucosamine pyrophosphatase LpxH